MSYNRCPPFPCTVPPIRTGVFGSGRLFQPAPLALQAPGYAYLGGDQNPMSPLVTSPPCGPADVPPGCVPAAPPTSQTTVVGAGILSPVRWRGNGVFADNYALPGDIAREPNEGWWASETIDADTGTRSWITSMSGLGSLGAASGWLNRPLLNVGGVTIPRWIGLGALVAGLWWLNKKKGWVKNRGRSRRRNASGEHDQHAVRELALFIENDGDLYRQQFSPILKNLATKAARGIYDHGKAVKLFMYLVDNGAKTYCKRFGCASDWHRTFNTSTRRAVAESLAKSFEVENGLGSYKHLLAKKYQKNRRRTRRSRRSGR